jgi:cell wall-associated NlpC family hydrolase
MVTRDQIVARARDYLGVRWRHQGRTMDGVDCAGLVVCVGKDLGIIDYDRTDYQRRPDFNRFPGFFLDGGAVRRRVGTERPGDILVFREDRYPCHTGLVSLKNGKPHLIHAYLIRKMVEETPLDEHWLSRRVAAFTYPGIEA